MPSIPYSQDYQGEAAKIAEVIRERRGGALFNLDRMLLYHPPLAESWNYMMAHVRDPPLQSLRHRELAICAVSFLTDAPYERQYHAPAFLRAGGTEAQLAALIDVPRAAADTAVFDAADRAVLALTLDSTRDVRIAPATMAAARAAFPDPGAVAQLVMIVASYNMVSRVLVGLDVGLDTP